MPRFWKAGSLTSEKGSCTLTLLLDKMGREVREEEADELQALQIWVSYGLCQVLINRICFSLNE